MSTTESANNSQIICPSADAVLLLDNDNNTYQSPAMATAVAFSPKRPSLRDQYATAHVVGGDVSPFSSRLVDVTETHATATALDPWSKQKTTSTETRERESSETPTSVYRPPAPLTETEVRNVVNGTDVLPAAALEDPCRKKYRRRIRRRLRMIVGGAAGFVVGSVILGPFGGIAFGFGAVAATKSVSKAGERRKDKRVQQEHQQRNSNRVVIVPR